MQLITLELDISRYACFMKVSDVDCVTKMFNGEVCDDLLKYAANLTNNVKHRRFIAMTKLQLEFTMYIKSM